jgi:hypothetical protein
MLFISLFLQLLGPPSPGGPFVIAQGITPHLGVLNIVDTPSRPQLPEKVLKMFVLIRQQPKEWSS